MVEVATLPACDMGQHPVERPRAVFVPIEPKLQKVPQDAAGLRCPEGVHPGKTIRQWAAIVAGAQRRGRVTQGEQPGAYHRGALGGVHERVDGAGPQAVGHVDGAPVRYHASAAFTGEAPGRSWQELRRRVVVTLHEQPGVWIVQVRRLIGHVTELTEVRPGRIPVRLDPADDFTAYRSAVQPGLGRIETESVADVPLPPDARKGEAAPEQEAIPGRARIVEQVRWPGAVELGEGQPPAPVGNVEYQCLGGSRRGGHDRDVSGEDDPAVWLSRCEFQVHDSGVRGMAWRHRILHATLDVLERTIVAEVTAAGVGPSLMNVEADHGHGGDSAAGRRNDASNGSRGASPAGQNGFLSPMSVSSQRRSERKRIARAWAPGVPMRARVSTSTAST